jgi:hypothetical protein
MIRGNAIPITSRPPLGRVHQFRMREVIGGFLVSAKWSGRGKETGKVRRNTRGSEEDGFLMISEQSLGEIGKALGNCKNQKERWRNGEPSTDPVRFEISEPKGSISGGGGVRLTNINEKSKKYTPYGSFPLAFSGKSANNTLLIHQHVGPRRVSTFSNHVRRFPFDGAFSYLQAKRCAVEIHLRPGVLRLRRSP